MAGHPDHIWRRFAVVVALAATGGFSAPATATPSRAELAREHSARGTVEYNLGRYDAAVRQFEEAYRLLPEPVLLYNLGQAHRFAGRPAPAITAYRAYLRSAPRDAPKREQVERWVADLEVMVSTRVETAPAATPPRLAAPVLPAVERGPAAAGGAAPEGTLSARPRPAYSTWWFWTAIGAALVAGSATAYVLASSRGSGASPPLGKQRIFEP